ncbi:hypothetical protein Tsubulata_023594, partial [Turnera subulata]
MESSSSHLLVHAIARELIKPSYPQVQHQEPYKLSLLDQLTPTTFSPMVFFYPSRNDDPKSNIIVQLKRAFIATWSSISRGDVKRGIPILPTKILIPTTIYLSWRTFRSQKLTTSQEASLKAKAANGNPEAKTSSIETLSCFIWKCCMSATKDFSSGSPKPSILVEAVNLMHQTKLPMADASIGDNFWRAIALAHPTDEKRELHDLVNLPNDAISLYDGGYTQSLQGEETMEECCNQLARRF